MNGAFLESFRPKQADCWQLEGGRGQFLLMIVQTCSKHLLNDGLQETTWINACEQKWNLGLEHCLHHTLTVCALEY